MEDATQTLETPPAAENKKTPGIFKRLAGLPAAAYRQTAKLAGNAFDATMLTGLNLYFRAVHRTDVRGAENFKDLAGKPLVIVANHITFWDAMLLAATLPRDIRPAFAMDMGTYNALTGMPLVGRAAKFVMSRSGVYPLDTARPQALRELTRLAQSGRPVMIFPEGRRTPTGTLMQTIEGAATIAENAGANIVPVHLGGLEFFGAGRWHLMKNHPWKLFPKLSVSFGAPRKIEVPEEMTRKQAREFRLRELEKIMEELPLIGLDKKETLFGALRNTVRDFGKARTILSDIDPDTQMTNSLNYGKLMIGAYALGERIASRTEKGEFTGFLLPNSIGASVAFWGMQAYGRVPTLLNAKMELGDMVSCAETAALKTIVTSRRMVDKAKLETRIAALEEKGCKIVYLEDLKQEIGRGRKAKALLQARGLLPAPKGHKADDPAVVLFTSGSESLPKGVVLSAQNILSNVAQIQGMLPLSEQDRIFNAMPIFHSFGMTGGLIMPTLKGLHSLQFLSPLEGGKIPKAIYFDDSTIMFGTDTFLNLYARKGKGKDLSRLRMIFAGAEELKEKTFQTYAEKFGVICYQGYGMTEAAPCVTINAPGAHKKGTVGRFVPGMQHRLEPVEGIENGGRLYLKGPNIMLGYIKHDNPGVIQPLENGEHDTGDIISLIEDFAKISGRAKRFAKIGGEMVALDAIEAIARHASAQMPNIPPAIVKKGGYEQATILKKVEQQDDRIVLFTTNPDLKRDNLTKAAQDMGKSLLGVPKKSDIVFIDEIPHLPTGKTDYVSLTKRFNAMAVNNEETEELDNLPADDLQGGNQSSSPSSPAP